MKEPLGKLFGRDEASNDNSVPARLLSCVALLAAVSNVNETEASNDVIHIRPGLIEADVLNLVRKTLAEFQKLVMLVYAKLQICAPAKRYNARNSNR